jgi:hypothetical protein
LKKIILFITGLCLNSIVFAQKSIPKTINNDFINYAKSLNFEEGLISYYRKNCIDTCGLLHLLLSGKENYEFNRTTYHYQHLELIKKNKLLNDSSIEKFKAFIEKTKINNRFDYAYVVQYFKKQEMLNNSLYRKYLLSNLGKLNYHLKDDSKIEDAVKFITGEWNLLDLISNTKGVYSYDREKTYNSIDDLTLEIQKAIQTIVPIDNISIKITFDDETISLVTSKYKKTLKINNVIQKDEHGYKFTFEFTEVTFLDICNQMCANYGVFNDVVQNNIYSIFCSPLSQPESELKDIIAKDYNTKIHFYTLAPRVRYESKVQISGESLLNYESCDFCYINEFYGVSKLNTNPTIPIERYLSEIEKDSLKSFITSNLDIIKNGSSFINNYLDNDMLLKNTQYKMLYYLPGENFNEIFPAQMHIDTTLKLSDFFPELYQFIDSNINPYSCISINSENSYSIYFKYNGFSATKICTKNNILKTSASLINKFIQNTDKSLYIINDRLFGDRLLYINTKSKYFIEKYFNVVIKDVK